jgi:hypothetical protein
LILALAVFAASVAASGCEPLRQKFIRKKEKASLDNEMVPIFEPETYPPTRASAGSDYQYHYDLCLVWDRELVSNIDDRASDKKLLATLGQFRKELRAMAGLLSGPPADKVAAYLADTDELEAEFAKEAAFRNTIKMRHILRTLDHAIRQNLKMTMVKDHLKGATGTAGE